MLEKYNDAEAIVTVEGKTYALYKKGPLKRYPYIVDTSTGGIPDGQQLPIVKSYLQQNSVNIGKTWNTHWCIFQAISIAKTKRYDFD